MGFYISDTYRNIALYLGKDAEKVLRDDLEYYNSEQHCKKPLSWLINTVFVNYAPEAVASFSDIGEENSTKGSSFKAIEKYAYTAEKSIEAFAFYTAQCIIENQTTDEYEAMTYAVTNNDNKITKLENEIKEWLDNNAHTFSETEKKNIVSFIYDICIILIKENIDPADTSQRTPFFQKHAYELSHKLKTLYGKNEQGSLSYAKMYLERTLEHDTIKIQNSSVSKETKAVLRDTCLDGLLYKTPGDYIRAVIEEFTRLPQYRQEEIMFKSIVTELDQYTKYKLCEITTGSQKELVYSCGVRNENGKNYLICIMKHHSTGEFYYVPKRISRINNISVRAEHKNPKNYVEYEKFRRENDIGQSIKSHGGIAYLYGEPLEVTVRFTEKGVEMLQRIPTMRPAVISRCEASNTMVFKCTKFNAVSYFRRFGGDAVVISPSDVRNELTRIYAKALEEYSKE